MGVGLYPFGILVASWRYVYISILASFIFFYDLDIFLLQSIIWFGFFRVFPLLPFGGYLLRRLSCENDSTVSVLPIVIQVAIINFAYLAYNIQEIFIFSSWLGIYASQYNYSVGYYQGCKNIKPVIFFRKIFVHILSLAILTTVFIVDSEFTMLLGNAILALIVLTNHYSGIRLSFRHKLSMDVVLIFYALSQSVWMLLDRFIIELSDSIPGDDKFLYAVVSLLSTVIVTGVSSFIVVRKDWIVKVGDNNKTILPFVFLLLINFLLACVFIWLFGWLYFSPMFIAVASVVSIAANTRVFSSIKHTTLLLVFNVSAILVFCIKWKLGVDLAFLLLTMVAAKSIAPFLYLKFSRVN